MSSISNVASGLSMSNLKPLLRGSDYAKQVESMPAEVTDLGNGVVVERRGGQFNMTGDAKMSMRAKVAAYEAAQAGGKAGQAMFDTFRKTHPEEFGDAAVARDNALLSGRLPEAPPAPAAPPGARTAVKDGETFAATGAEAVNVSGGSRTKVTGSAVSDFITVLYQATVFGLAGHDRISARDKATLDGGEGDDWLSAGRDSTLVGGEGDDRLEAQDNAFVDGGDGDDRVQVGNDSRVIDSGGDNEISGYSTVRVTAGAGNDTITAYDGAVVNAGDGHNYVDVGAGSTVTAGSGEDYVRLGRGSEVHAGAGDDRVVVAGEAVIHFNRGDGHDVIDGGRGGVLSPAATDHLSSSTVAFGAGILPSDLRVKRDGDDIVVAMGNDSLTLRGASTHGIPTMTFTDGSTLSAEQVRAMADRTATAQAATQAAQRLRNASQVYQTQVNTTGTAI